MVWIRQIPQPCAAHRHFFSNIGQPCPGKALHGCARLLGRDHFVSVALLFISPFLSPLEEIVLMFLFSSLF